MLARGGVRTVSRGIAWTGLALAAVTLAQRATAPTLLYWSFPTVFGAPFGPYRNRNDFAMLSRPIDEVMTAAPVSVKPDALVGEALRLLRERQIDQLPVVDERRRPVGLLDIQDLLAIRALSAAP